jgi:hypothetical protein
LSRCPAHASAHRTAGAPSFTGAGRTKGQTFCSLSARWLSVSRGRRRGCGRADRASLRQTEAAQLALVSALSKRSTEPAGYADIAALTGVPFATRAPPRPLAGASSTSASSPLWRTTLRKHDRTRCRGAATNPARRNAREPSLRRQGTRCSFYEAPAALIGPERSIETAAPVLLVKLCWSADVGKSAVRACPV